MLLKTENFKRRISVIQIENRVSAMPVRADDFSQNQNRVCEAIGVGNISTDSLSRKPLQYQQYNSRFNHHSSNDPSCSAPSGNNSYGQYGNNSQGHPGQYSNNSYGQNGQYGNNSQGHPGQYSNNSYGQNGQYGNSNQGHPGQYSNNSYGQYGNSNQGHPGQYSNNSYGQNGQYGNSNQSHPGQYSNNSCGQNASQNPYAQNSPFRNAANAVQNNNYTNNQPGGTNVRSVPQNQFNNGSQQNPAPTPVQTPPQPAAPPKRKRPPLPAPVKLLKKGEKYSITKNHPGSNRLRIGIGWDMAVPVEYDMDLEAFMLNETEKVPDDSWIVYYGQLRSPDTAVTHRGEEGTDFGPDCEQIDVMLNSVSRQISKIAFVLTINEAKKNRYNFSGIKNAYIRVTDISTGKELFRYELTDYYREVVSMVVGEMYMKNGEWRFNPVGMGTGDDLEGLCNRYGIEVSD